MTVGVQVTRVYPRACGFEVWREGWLRCLTCTPLEKLLSGCAPFFFLLRLVVDFSSRCFRRCLHTREYGPRGKVGSDRVSNRQSRFFFTDGRSASFYFCYTCFFCILFVVHGKPPLAFCDKSFMLEETSETGGV